MTDADDQAPLEPRLTFSEVHPGHVEVHIEPLWRPEWAIFAARSPTDPRPSGSLLSYDATRSTLIIRPLVTNLSTRFLEPKHGPITELVFEDFRASLPETEQDVRDLLRGLPTGFITAFEFGLGVEKEYLPILEAVRRVRGVTCLVLTHSHKTGPDESLFYLTYDDYDDVHRAIHRVTQHYRAEARIDRKILAHNDILTTLDPVSYPEATRAYAPGTVFKLRRAAASPQNSRATMAKR